MTIENKIAVDNKITALGFEGCYDFMFKVPMNALITRDNFRRRVRSYLLGEDWDELTELFLNWEA